MFTKTGHKGHKLMTDLLTDMVPHTHETYDAFCRDATFYALCRISDLTMFANPLECDEDNLSNAGVSFPVTIFG